MNTIVQNTRTPPVSDDESTEKAATGMAPPAKPGRDARRARRLPVPPAHQPCELRVKPKILAAALVNESETGFAVLIDRLDGLAVGEEVDLHTDSGWIPVQIVYIEEVAPCAYTATKCDTLFQLGVKKTQGTVPS
jgi:hypothetical protein